MRLVLDDRNGEASRQRVRRVLIQVRRVGRWVVEFEECALNPRSPARSTTPNLNLLGFLDQFQLNDIDDRDQLETAPFRVFPHTLAALDNFPGDLSDSQRILAMPK